MHEGPQCSRSCLFGRVFVPSWFAKNPVKLAVVCEAPGYREVEQLEPLVGPAGKLFNKMCQEAGIERSDCMLINTVCCVAMEREDRRPLPAEIDACRPRLLRDLEFSGADAIISMGNISHLLFFPGATVSKVRGTIRAWSHPETQKVYPVISTFHPAYALPHRSPQVGPLIVEDLKTALDFCSRET